MAPETKDDVVIQLNETLKSSVKFRDYEDVKVLALYWEEADQGFKNEGAAESRSVWAAFREGDPILEWYKLQDILREADTDILLILDCCYAGQSARDRDPGRGGFEILAAAAMGVTTPPPGNTSFTTIFLDAVRDTVTRERCVNIKDLHGRLSARQHGLFAQPVHTVLKRGHASIVLKPLSTTAVIGTQEKETQALLHLLIHLEEELSSKYADHIGQWLRTNMPYTISGLEVVDRTKEIQKAVQDVQESQKPYLNYVDVASKGHIIDAWKGVVALLEKHLATRSDQQSIEGEAGSGRRIGELVKQLDAQNTAVFHLFEESILTATGIDGNEEALQNAIEDNAIKALGISGQLRIRRIVRSGYPYYGQTEPSSSGRNQTDRHVMDEYKVYGEYISPEQMPRLVHRVEKLYQLLNEPKDNSFCALKCIERSHQLVERRFTFTFEIPPEFDSCRYMSLERILKNMKGRQRPSMNQRLRISLLLARAIYKWHRIGWLYQGIGSPNVIFFRTKDKQLDYPRPFLHGFDFSRPDSDSSVGIADKDDGLDVYRHPESKDDSPRTFKKKHDYYSLGVVMLEIGLWQKCSRFLDKGLTAEQIQTELQKNCADRLAHYAGESYQAAVGVCLKGDFGVELDDEHGNVLLGAFQTKVIDEIQKGICL
ncbi:hypothetical protein F4779DRAFT_636685 [Xylariaceae sp. FL0662B]|nr:hypothetical protein F4779DRAFT_636685 [Xylariaceae sp. FL0662B]